MHDPSRAAARHRPPRDLPEGGTALRRPLRIVQAERHPPDRERPHCRRGSRPAARRERHRPVERHRAARIDRLPRPSGVSRRPVRGHLDLQDLADVQGDGRGGPCPPHPGSRLHLGPRRLLGPVPGTRSARLDQRRLRSGPARRRLRPLHQHHRRPLRSQPLPAQRAHRRVSARARLPGGGRRGPASSRHPRPGEARRRSDQSRGQRRRVLPRRHAGRAAVHL